MTYPPASLSTDFTDATPSTGVHAARHNDTCAAVNTVVAHLGSNPASTYATVGDRLNALSSGITGAVLRSDYGQAGDMLYAASSGVVAAIPTTSAVNGHVLWYDGFNPGWTTPMAPISVNLAATQALLKSPVPLFCYYADSTSTSTDGTEDDLRSTTIAAGQLANDGDRLEWEAAIKFVAHATATRRLKFYFAGTAIFDSTVPTAYASGASYVVRVTITRVSASVVRCRSIVMGSDLGPGAILGGGIESEITGLTLANTQIAKSTGIAAGTGAASGDIIARSSSITYVPAP